MYIPEFWCGVLATVGIEFALLIMYAVYTTWKKK